MTGTPITEQENIQQENIEQENKIAQGTPEANEHIAAPAEGENAAESAEPAEAAAPAGPDWDDRENAPRSQAVEEDTRKADRYACRKRRRAGVTLPLVILLLIIVLVFGLAAGYMTAYNTLSGIIDAKEARIAELTLALESAPAAAQDAPEASDEAALTPENEAALADLSGEGFTMNDGDVSVLVTEDNLFTGESAAAEAAPVVVAEFNGGTLMSDEVRREYNRQITTYTFAGYSEAEDGEAVLSEVMQYMVSDRVLEAKARELGLYDLTSADLDQIETEAAAQYADQVAFARLFVREDGMSEEAVTAAAQAYLAETEGVTPESVRAELEKSWWLQKLYAYVVRGVQVSPSDIVALYNSKLTAQKESFEAYPEDFEYAQRSGETIVYNLPGYRAVKLLMLGFDSAETFDQAYDLTQEIAALDPVADSARIAELQAQLDSCYAASEATAQDILSQLASGASFDDMLDRYGEDEGMRTETLRRTGYYVSENSVVWADAVISAAMSLATPGDVSGVIRLDDGVCILQYLGDVTPGAVPQANIYDEISAETLENAQVDAYNAQVNAWLEAAAPVYYPERLR